MDIIQLLPYIQIFLAILLVFLILVQKSESGVGGAFGGEQSSEITNKRRGGEKVIFVLTFLAVVLFITSILFYI